MIIITAPPTDTPLHLCPCHCVLSICMHAVFTLPPATRLSAGPPCRGRPAPADVRSRWPSLPLAPAQDNVRQNRTPVNQSEATAATAVPAAGSDGSHARQMGRPDTPQPSHRRPTAESTQRKPTNFSRPPTLSGSFVNRPIVNLSGVARSELAAHERWRTLPQ